MYRRFSPQFMRSAVTLDHDWLHRRLITTPMIMGVALLAFVIKLHIAASTIGTNDVTTWQHFATQVRTLGAAELYRRERDFNHPPLMGHLLWLIGWLGVHSGLPFPLWLRLPAIIADLVALILVVRLVGPSLPVLLLAACPPLIMISGFHGNTDPVMVMWLLVAVWLLECTPPAFAKERGHPRLQRVGASGVAVALALSTKIVPVILLPVFLLWLPTWRGRIVFLACLCTVTLVTSLPVLVQAPGAIVRNVLNYKSIYGQWGITRLLWITRIFPRAPWLALADRGFERYGRIVDGGATLVVALWMNLRGRRKPSLFMQCGLTLLVFLALSPGFGVQYLAWIMPWVVAASLRASIYVYATSTVFLASVYAGWANSWPWNYADSLLYYGWSTRIDTIAFELITWGTVVGAAVILASSLCAAGVSDAETMPYTDRPHLQQ